MKALFLEQCERGTEPREHRLAFTLRCRNEALGERQPQAVRDVVFGWLDRARAAISRALSAVLLFSIVVVRSRYSSVTIHPRSWTRSTGPRSATSRQGERPRASA